MRSGCDGTIGGLADELGSDVGGVAETDLTLKGCGDQDIAFNFENLIELAKR